MPGLPCSYGEVTRIDIPTPFFLRDEAFKEFKNDNYNWGTNKSITLLLKGIKKSSTKPQVDPNESGDITLEGCPLECPFEQSFETFEEQKIHVPAAIFPGLDFNLNNYDSMDLQTCRTLVKKIYEGDEEIVQNLCLDRVAGKHTYSNPIYVACDGSPNAKDLVLIGFEDEKFLELRMMGPYKRQSTQLNLELFLAYHQHLPNVNPSSIQRQVHAVYEKPHSENSSEGKVFIEFLWSDPKNLFESPPPASSVVKLAITPKPGANLHLKKLWDEILILENFMEQLKHIQNEADRSFISLNNTDSNSSSLSDDIKQFLTIQSAPNWNKNLGDFTDSLDTIFERLVSADRNDKDFTDKLWAIIKRAKSVHELLDCFTKVFNAVDSNLYRPYLFPSNSTLVNYLLKKYFSGNTCQGNFRSELNPLLIMEMTIDCGIHKLYKDYCFALGMCHLAEKIDLKLFAPIERMYKDSMINIKKMHCILEVLSLSKERLSLSISQLESQTRILLRYFSNHPLDWQHTFHFSVSMDSVAPIIARLHPVYWNLKLESSNDLRIARTNAILSRDFFVCHARKFYVNNDGAIPKGYFLYVHRVAQRKI